MSSNLQTGALPKPAVLQRSSAAATLRVHRCCDLASSSRAGMPSSAQLDLAPLSACFLAGLSPLRLHLVTAAHGYVAVRREGEALSRGIGESRGRSIGRWGCDGRDRGL